MDPILQASYARCRELNARHGRTYFLATRLLPPARRPAVHALYAFARWADDIVDSMADTRPWSERAAELARLEHDLDAGLSGQPSGHPILPALCDTATRYQLDPQHLWAFFDSMRMDAVGSQTEVREYRCMAQLEHYMYGSAAVIGLLMLPVLGTRTSREEAAPFAATLGVAFQLTNFLRDVGEDLDRGRVYLPADELAAFGVDRQQLQHARTTGRTEPRVRRALAHLVALTRSRYREAEAGIGMLEPVAQPCVRTAFTLYGDILTEIERADYDVFSGRVVVSRHRRLAVAGPGLVRAAARRATTRRAAEPCG
ncbi:MAG: phytoene/squalene synthase family protein [Actinomycetota bacterium]|nr:phytoene/squalene synthase family protein [Actinomycetota bacterium]